ncbi:MAG: heavy metal translocating P-type ATPase [Clostridia bacterium]
MEESCCSVHQEDEQRKKGYVINIVGIIVFLIGIVVDKGFDLGGKIYIPFYIVGYILIGYDIFFNAFKKIFKKDMFDENSLMTIATLGAFALGEYAEGAAVLLFYKIGELLQDIAIKNSKRKIEKVIDIRAEVANLKVDSEVLIVNPKKIKTGDIIIVKTGEKVPLDGVVIQGNTMIDMSALNGESVPKHIVKGDELLSGSINLGGVVTLRVTKSFTECTVSKIIELIQNAASKKSKTEKFITKFAKVYTPIVIVLALVIAISFPFILDISFFESVSRALIFLVVSCPCALVVSVPLGFFIGIGSASKRGILVKGSNYIDILSNLNTIVFDKTGTLTKGVFKVTNIEAKNGFKDTEVLESIALCEVYSNHYIAKSILSSFQKNIDKSRISMHEEISGYGIKATVDNKKMLVGNYELIKKENANVVLEESNGTIIYLLVDGVYAGHIVMSDELKQDSKTIVTALKKNGIKDIVMLTGDRGIVAKEYADKLNIDKVYSDLLPKDKVEILKEIKSKLNSKEKIGYIGDGINDGPALALADVGISMGMGSDIAIESSDVVFMSDEPSKIIDAIKISKKTMKIVRQNIIFALVVKISFLVFSSLGVTSMWWAVFSDVGVSLIAIFNCLRILNIKNK